MPFGSPTRVQDRWPRLEVRAVLAWKLHYTNDLKKSRFFNSQDVNEGIVFLPFFKTAICGLDRKGKGDVGENMHFTFEWFFGRREPCLVKPD